MDEDWLPRDDDDAYAQLDDDFLEVDDDPDEEVQDLHHHTQISVKFRTLHPNSIAGRMHIAEGSWPVEQLDFATKPSLPELMTAIRGLPPFRADVHDGTHVRGKVSLSLLARL
jgi:hypothetical protein